MYLEVYLWGIVLNFRQVRGLAGGHVPGGLFVGNCSEFSGLIVGARGLAGGRVHGVMMYVGGRIFFGHSDRRIIIFTPRIYSDPPYHYDIELPAKFA
jgi:hypothetical protein